MSPDLTRHLGIEPPVTDTWRPWQLAPPATCPPHRQSLDPNSSRYPSPGWIAAIYPHVTSPQNMGIQVSSSQLDRSSVRPSLSSWRNYKCHIVSIASPAFHLPLTDNHPTPSTFRLPPICCSTFRFLSSDFMLFPPSHLGLFGCGSQYDPNSWSAFSQKPPGSSQVTSFYSTFDTSTPAMPAMDHQS